MLKARTLLITVGCTGLAAGASANTAATGLVCRNQDSLTTTMFYDTSGVAKNSSADRKTWLCSVLRLSHSGIPSSKIVVRDQHPNEAVECYGTNRGYDWAYTSWTPVYASAATGSQELNLGPMNSPSGLDATFITCTVPGVSSGQHSGVEGYWIAEN